MKNIAKFSHRVVIIGGGFAGISATRALAHTPVGVTLIDRRNFHLFQPLLYQVATGGLSPANIAAPLRAVLRRQRNVRVLMGEVETIDTARRQVLLSDGAAIEYDTLVVATGVSHFYFGHDEWATVAPGLKTVEDAVEIRRRIFTAFEAAERETDPGEVERWLSFVIVGAGPTGVEMAGALSELARQTLTGNFRSIDPASAQIHLVEGESHVLPVYRDGLSEYAARQLEAMGVRLHLNAIVTAIEGDVVTLKKGDQTYQLDARTVLWAAGVRATPLTQRLSEATGVALDRAGRVIVAPDLTIPGHAEIFVIGDMANFRDQDGKPLPGLAQVALQEGKYVARQIEARLAHKSVDEPFMYHDIGTMATIGRAAAVADLRFIQLKGFIAWLAWLFIHLMWLVSFQNRVLVFFQWAGTYLSRNRSARLITAGGSPLSLEREGGRADRDPGARADEQQLEAAPNPARAHGLRQRGRDGSRDAI